MAEAGVIDSDVDPGLEKKPPPTRDPIIARSSPPPVTPPLSGITPISAPSFQPATPPRGPVDLPPPTPYANIPTPGIARPIPTPGTTPPPVPTPQLDPSRAWQRMPPGQLYNVASLPPLAFAMGQPESGMDNAKVGDNGLATGLFQIQTPTWQDFAPRVGVDLKRWPTAASAPPQVQWAVAQNIPLSRWTAGQQGARRLYPWADPHQTVGQVLAQAQKGTFNQQYIPASQTPGLQNRPASEWGRPPPGGYPAGPGNMPSLFDIPRVMQQGMALLPLLSMFTRGGFQMAATGFASYVDGYQKGQLLKQKLAKDQWQNGLNETIARMEQESIEAGDAFSAYGANEEALQQALGEIASKYGDNAMSAALAQGGSKAVEALEQRRDQYYTDLNKTKLAQEKAQTALQIQQLQLQKAQTTNETEKIKLQQQIQKLQQQQKAGELWGGAAPATDEPATGDTGGGDQPTTTDPDQAETTTPEQPEEGAPETEAGTGAQSGGPSQPTQKPVQPGQAPAGPQTARTTPTPSTAQPSAPAGPSAAPLDMPKALAQLPSGVRQLGMEMFRGGQPASGTDKNIINAAEAYEQWLQGQMDQIQSSGATGKDVVDQLRRIDPVSANTLQRLLDHQAGVPGTGGFGTRLADYWNKMQDLAVQADPSWNAGQFAASVKTRDSYTPQGAMGKTLLRAQRLRQTTQSLWADAATLPAGPIPENVLQQMLQGGVAADPRYTKFATDWHNFAVDIQAVNTGGAPTVTLTSMLLDTLKRGATPAMVRTAVKADLNSALGSIDSAMTGWRQAFPKEGNPAMFNQRTYSDLWQLWNGNVNTGVLGDGAPQIGAVQDGHVYVGGDPSDPLNWKAQ